MYKNTLRVYSITFLIINLMVGLVYGIENMDIFLFNVFFGLMYAFVLYPIYLKHQKSSILMLSGIYSAFFIIVLNLISYQHNGNYYVFSEADSLIYDQKARDVIYNFNTIPQILSKLNFDDWGGVIVVSIAYLLGPSNLFLNLLYWLMGLTFTLYLNKLASFFMSKEYAFYCALAFSLSSFVLWFESSGLKEISIIFLMILAYYHLYKFQFQKKPSSLIWGLLFTVLLIFFRTVLPVFVIVSFVLTVLLGSKQSFYKVFLIFGIIALTLSFSFVIENIYSRFNLFNRDASFVEIKEESGMIKESLLFTYLVSIVSAFIGPFPTFDSSNKIILSLFSSGLYLKSLFGLPLILGWFYIIKERIFKLFPIIIFPLLEIFSLILILDALELRKSLPHFPMLYIIIFWFLYQLQSQKNNKKYKYKNFKTVSIFYFLAIISIVIFWNFRN